MKSIITSILFLFGCSAMAQDYVVLFPQDTIEGSIRFNNFENSLQFVEIKTEDSIYVFSTDSVKEYKRGTEQFISLSQVKDSILVRTFYKSIIKGKKYDLFAFYDGELKYLVVDKKYKTKTIITQKNFHRKLPRAIRKERELGQKVRRKELGFKQIVDVIKNANNPNLVALSNKEFYGKREKKVPIYTGTDPLKPIISPNVYQPKGRGGFGSSSTSTTTISDEQSWFFYNFGLYTGWRYYHSNFFNKGIPASHLYAIDHDFAFFQRAVWFGGKAELAFVPWLNEGNACNSSLGLSTRIFIGPYFNLYGAYNWNLFRYNVRPHVDEIPCSNIKPDGEEYYANTFKAVHVFKSKHESIELGIGIHAKGGRIDPWLGFNDITFLVSRNTLNPTINQFNYDYVKSTGTAFGDVPDGHQFWTFSIRVGWRTYWTPY